MEIIKRDGRKVAFNRDKIERAILKAFLSVDNDWSDYAVTKAQNIASQIEDIAKEKTLTRDDIQDLVENGLMSTKRKDVARAYISYRHDRDLARGNSTDKIIYEMLDGTNEYWSKENSNKNPYIVTTQRYYLAGITSTDLTKRFLLPQDILKAHEEGILHFHDMDYFAQNALTNCCLINLEDMLQNGTSINGVLIEKPHRLLTATTIATQIITAVASSQYGGCTISLSHLVPFVKSSQKYHYDRYKQRNLSEHLCETFAHEDLMKEIKDAVQTFNYQINSMSTTNGQAPFLSVFMYLNEVEEEDKYYLALLIEEFLKQRILGFKNEKGVYITQAFPKLLYVLEEDNIDENGKYYYLTELAAKCTAKRMVPDYISEKKMKELKDGDCFPCMGCRSFLAPYKDENNKSKYYGRFNFGVVTLNLVEIALASHKDINKFWEIFEKNAELCHAALKIRYKRVSQITSDAAPILWQHGAFARLQKGESVKPLLENGYASASLGYAGLYECVKYMTGKSHADEAEGTEFAMSVMRKLNELCNKWKKEENIGYSIYGSPIESTTYKFAKCLKKRYGIIPEITEYNYITNSYNINVREHINAFDKLRIESKFQELSLGGAISYVEVPNMQNNIPAVLTLIKFIYENIMYAEINSKSDYCQKCGFDGEIQIKEQQDGTLIWECPNCGNTQENTLNIARRTCGYIGTNLWNQGRTQEIRDRTIHLD